MIRRPPRSTLSSSSAASDVYKRQTVDTVIFSHVLYQLSYLGTSKPRKYAGDAATCQPRQASAKRVIAQLPLESEPGEQGVGDVDGAAQQRLGVGLALRVGEQAGGAAAAEGVVEDEVEGEDVGDLETLDRTRGDTRKHPAHRRRREVLAQPGVHHLVARDHPDVRGLALVAGTAVGQPFEKHLGHPTPPRIA